MNVGRKLRTLIKRGLEREASATVKTGLKRDEQLAWYRILISTALHCGDLMVKMRGSTRLSQGALNQLLLNRQILFSARRGWNQGGNLFDDTLRRVGNGNADGCRPHSRIVL